ncbi:hypothetical protein JRG49_17850 [Pseudomonas fulva]|jgi:hypothetical protein|uniref:hypothetical protein n=1 Tax=Pseudomonas TaxID=286 RepID=UPI0015E2A995|nr:MULTISPECIES: hypothetical protein [Pseudomonas]MCY3929443.1 hypothetical protein [Acidobacteriota bacterium]MBA1221869.1 hypothetical protein [Pseudomonas fulva]MBN4166795.1 hypothetical protein [Pseudomonas fulva]MBN6791904.1 hypothetical protein [Pseudomonas fulva]MBN6796923.1 hypothetical protein [Pseudomonas fulva]
MNHFPAVAALDGEVLSEAVLDAREMCYMNFAREEHKKLEKILLTLVIPAMGGYDNELACDIAHHLEQIQSFSGNYCWRHRHLGASHGVVGQPAANGGLV